MSSLRFLVEHSFMSFLLVLAIFHVSAFFCVLYFVSLEKKKVRRRLTGNVVCLESERRKRQRRCDRTLVRRVRPGRRSRITFRPL